MRSNRPAQRTTLSARAILYSPLLLSLLLLMVFALPGGWRAAGRDMGVSARARSDRKHSRSEFIPGNGLVRHDSEPVDLVHADAEGMGTITNYGGCPSSFMVSDAGDIHDSNLGDGICADGLGHCTLRAAIEESNALTSCATLTINLSVAGITLTLGELTIDHDLIVNGSAPNGTTISGNHAGRVFTVNAGRTDNFSNLTITNGTVGSGVTGGGILNNGTLTINDSTISNNVADFGAGIFNQGRLTITNTTINSNSTIGGLGGGISSGGSGSSLNMFNSTVSNSTDGGGILIGGGNTTVEIANCTISSNATQDSGGGLRVLGTSLVILTNSTVTGNRSDKNSCCGANGGGIEISVGTTTFLRNTLVAGNFRGPGSTADDIHGSVFPSSSFNVIGTGGSGGLTNGTDHNQVGVTMAQLGLGPLANNGGPTQTHVMVPSSPAVDAGDDCVTQPAHCGDPNLPQLTTDQRGPGFIRLGGGHVDVGAIEIQGTTAADSTVSGIVTTADGAAVVGATVKLSGTESRRTVTDSEGRYRFNNVETNGFYTVTPARANYSFNPASRSFSLLANKPDEVFTAVPDATPLLNPLDTAEYFVRQQYVDVLGREPDEVGLNFWSDRILVCGNDTDCIRSQRIAVAAEFFIHQEFQQSGAFIYNLYQGALSRRPEYAEYTIDRQQVVGGPNLEAEKQAFAESFVQRAEFMQKYQASSTAEGFVDAMLRQTAGVDLVSQRDGLIAHYNTGTNQTQSRSFVLRDVTENPAVRDANYNAAFVLTEYFGYLHRGPDRRGYDFWLNVLDGSVGGDKANYSGMVCAFITSAEYQRRFSTVVSHGNGECGPQP